MVIYLPSTKSTNQYPYLHGEIMIIFIDKIIYTHEVNVKGGGTREVYISLWSKSCNTNTCTNIQDIILFGGHSSFCCLLMSLTCKSIYIKT